MTALLMIALIIGIISFALVFLAGCWGVLFASLLTSLGGSFIYLSLSGFGNPTGAVPKHDTSDYLITAIPIFLGSFLVYYGCFYAKVQLSNGSAPKLLTIIWASSLFLLVTFYMGKKIIMHINERHIYIELGYDKELDLTSQDVSIYVTHGSRSEYFSFYSRGFAKKKNSYGYSCHISSSKDIYFKPQEIQINILQKNKIPISLPEGTEDIRMYVDKDFLLKIFVNEKLLSSHQL